MLRRKKNKYNSKKVNGFASKYEEKVFYELNLMQKAGEIKELTCQPKFILQEANKDNRSKQITYTADFMYIRNIDNQKVVVEVKSVMTAKLADYSIRRRLFLARYKGLEFQEYIKGNKKGVKIYKALEN